MRGRRIKLLGALALACSTLASCGADQRAVAPAPVARAAAPAVSLPDFPADHTLAAPPAVGEEPPPAPVSVRRALLVGIDRAPGSTTLTGAVSDAETTRDALVRHGWSAESITVLRDGEATRAAILAAIAQLAGVPSDGRVVFMFAGHTRRSGTQNQLLTADGARLSAPALASALGAVKAPMWASFPTCYAAGFAVPGIVGPGRVVTFASAAAERAYEATWLQRSFLVEYMVHREMLGAWPAPSVEQAFERAHAGLGRDYP
ncbi:MAG TPA: hypothetical protein VM840_09325, partial [Actinomycetota bacterium]|nr:hypothetical protein [Actinomycetota bacterium]